MKITKPSIIRVARKAGVKSISEECYDIIRKLIDNKIDDLAKNIVIVNGEHQTKTVMLEDLYNAFVLKGEYISQSNYLGKTTIV